ncbi:hypothetical protein KDA23_03650 [Candidatus Saccharibacteria bacterium]|nr:hypothetical protein [Candidatus Saccharibacteria bacterium]
MSNISPEIGYLYINGLGDGTITLKDRVINWWWHRAGMELQHAHINWYDGNDLSSKLADIEHQVSAMLQSFGGVAIIGSSAGGSLAVNSFFKLRESNVCVISSHGRLAAGDFGDNQRNSLHQRAQLDTEEPSKSFFDSVQMAESEVIPGLSDSDKGRMLVLTQLADMVVPLNLMAIDDVQQHRSLAFGHSGGFVAHMIGDRDMIRKFATSCLLPTEG